LTGFRWQYATRDGNPFNCRDCGERDKQLRNCGNIKELSEDTKAITEWTDEIKDEIKDKKATKVFSLGDIRLYECPYTYIANDTWEIIRLCYFIDDTKHLLFSGGWSEQPFWLMEAWEIYKTECAKQIKEINKKR